MTAGRSFTDLQTATRWLAMVGALLLIVVVGAAVFAGAVSEHPPNAASGAPYLRPSGDHWLGTDDLGRDLWAQLVFGARVSLAVGLIAAVAASIVGVTAALVAGWYQGWVDVVIMRVVDVTLSLPFLVLVLVLATYFGRGLEVLIILIAAVLWARPARLLRSQVLKLTSAGHVVAARAMGVGTPRILIRHLLPRLVPLLLSQFVRAAVVAVVVQAGVAFLGLGDPSRPSWGTTLYFANNGNAVLTDAWLWWIVPPGLALAVLTVGLAFVGYTLEEWAEPRVVSHGWRRPTVRRLSDVVPEAAPETAALDIRDLTVVYDPTTGPAVDGVLLRLGRGRMLGLVGGSGSGKSTMANAVLGLLPQPGRITGGAILLGDQDLRRLGRIGLQQVRGRRVAIVPQAAMNSLNPIMTVIDQVAESARLGGQGANDAAAAAGALLGRVGIERSRHRAFPHELSGGQRQRVVIAMAVVNHPDVLVADEPTTGLDVITQRDLITLLQELRVELDLDVWLISHDLPLVVSSCDDMAIMDRGRVVEHGPVATVLGRPASSATTALIAAFPRVGDRFGPENHGASSVEADDSAPDPGAALRLEAVSVVYPGSRGRPAVSALDRIDLTVVRGERVALVGRSGAGKSTVTRLATGLVEPQTGSVEVLDIELVDTSPTERRSLRRRIQTVFQDPYDSLHPGMTVADIMAEPLVVAGVGRTERRAQVDAALESLDLVPVEEFRNRFAATLSGGQRQRVALARTLVAEPELILADEPTSMLDAALRTTVARQLAAVQDQLGATLLFVTHDLAMAGMVADRIVVLLDGRVVEDGPSSQVLFDPRSDEAIRLLEAVHDLDRAGTVPLRLDYSERQ